MMHFENVWEECEKSHGEITSENINTILSELELKINFYKKIIEISKEPSEDIQNIKSRTLGEILYTLTKISLKENINVYESLKISFESRR